MSLLVENPHSDAAKRERDAIASTGQPRTGRRLPKGKTALSIALKDHQMQWLAEYATDRYRSHYDALLGFRSKMMRYERIAEGNRSDRRGSPDADVSDAVFTIFDKSNRSLGLVSGFADFAFAQARDDIFGTAPYFAASPEGVADDKLATDITRHAHWKFNSSSVKSCLIDCLKLATDLGTAFPKVTWRREIETYQSIKTIALDQTGQPILKEDGSYVTPEDVKDLSPESLMQKISRWFAGVSGPAIPAAWREMLVDEQITVFDNIDARCIDYKDIAFDPTAPELDLSHTDVFHRLQIGLLDAKRIYNLTAEQYQEALNLIRSGTDGQREPRDHRSESTPAMGRTMEENANPPILLVEGYLRCNPFEAGDPIRIWCVFSPDLQTIFTCDYLANHTPGGILPVFSIPWFKVPNRAIGKGYFERFEDVDNFIDEQFNHIIYRDRMAAQPLTGYDSDIFDEDIEEGDFTVAPNKMWKMKPGRKIEEGISFVTVPDANHRAVDIMNMMMQMAQSRTGITSAAQGELSGVPEVNTATGVNQIISRGATLLKWPIDEVKDSLAKPLGCAICMLYANQEIDETFVWAEGRAPELIELKKDAVKGLKMNVRLTLTQSQNQTKHQNAQSAIQFITQYLGFPEPEKQAARPLFVQALQSLGFHGADQLVRQPITDAMSIAALLPPELQQPFIAIAAQMGLVTPEMLAPPQGGEGETPAAGGSTPPPLPPQAAA